MVAMMPPFPKDLTGPYSGFSAYPSKKEEVPQPKGGSGMIATALSRFFEAHGGEILVNKPAERLIVENGKMRGRGMRRRNFVSRGKGGALHGSHQAAGEYGAFERNVARRISWKA